MGLPARRDVANLLALTAIQASNAVLPILIFPLALKALGAGPYAQLVVAEAVSLAILPLVLYGFEVEGVARLVDLKLESDRAQISRLFAEVTGVRLGLFIVGLLLTGSVAPFFGKDVLWLALLWALVPLSHVFQSSWLFQGLEACMPLAICVIPARVLAVAGVLLIVRGEVDARWIPAIVGGLYCAAGLAAFSYAVFGLKLTFLRPTRESMRKHLVAGKEIFLGNVAVWLYRDLNVLLLGLAPVPPAGVAAYSIAEKVTKGIQASMRPLSQLYLPKALRAARAAARPGKRLLGDLCRMVVPQCAMLLLGIAVLLLGYCGFRSGIPWFREVPESSWIATLALGMSTATLLGVANFMLGTVGLNATGSKAYLLKSLLASGVASMAICFGLSFWIGETGGAVSFVAAEATLCVLIVLKYLRRNNESVY